MNSRQVSRVSPTLGRRESGLNSTSEKAHDRFSTYAKSAELHCGPCLRLQSIHPNASPLQTRKLQTETRHGVERRASVRKLNRVGTGLCSAGVGLSGNAPPLICPGRKLPLSRVAELRRSFPGRSRYRVRRGDRRGRRGFGNVGRKRVDFALA